jgi:hypothetical protein
MHAIALTAGCGYAVMPFFCCAYWIAQRLKPAVIHAANAADLVVHGAVPDCAADNMRCMSHPAAAATAASSLTDAHRADC